MLRGQIVLITGAGRGLGRAMAVELAVHGAVIVAAARNRQGLRETVDMIEAKGGNALALTADIRDETQVQTLVQQVMNRYRRIDVLVNNAGLMVGDVAFVDTSPALWREVLDTNLWGAFLCCHAVVPLMIRQRSGVIVNMTSGAAIRTGFLNVPYGVSKAGLDRLTLGLSAELKEKGIACISLSPPISATATVRRLYPERNIEGWAQPPELSAQALRILLQDDDPMRYTGQVLSVREYLQNKG